MPIAGLDSMPIVNLDKLNISLDKFNEVADGKYNIGQLKLSEDGTSVYRTNNHKTWKIFNNTKIGSEESLAIKYAFCNALSREGLSEDKIEDIKERLGISGSKIDVLKAGNIKPLSAAEVREVIDEYACDINKGRADGAKLRTSSEIYRGVSSAKLDSRATTRNRINAATLEKIETGADRSVNQFMDTLEYPKPGENIPLASRGIAMEICRALRDPAALTNAKKSIVLGSAPIQLTRESNGKISAKIILGDESGMISVNTELTRTELLAQMRKAIGQSDDVAGTGEEPKVDAEAIKERNAKLLEDLKSLFNVVQNPGAFNREVNQLASMMEWPAQLKLTDTDRMYHAKLKWRDLRMDPIVTRLSKALTETRGFDDRNVKLVNDVREVFYGNKNVDAKKLLNDISDVLNKKPADPKKNDVDAKLESGLDDLDENFNINAFLGGN